MKSTPVMTDKDQRPSKYTAQLFDCRVRVKIQLLKIPETCDGASKEGGAGMFARRIGNLLQAFSCVHRIAPIMEMGLCFAEIPVLGDGIVQFIDVETLVLKVHGVQEPCNELLPLIVRAVESWVEINR